jgi:hypothetical protein
MRYAALAEPHRRRAGRPAAGWDRVFMRVDPEIGRRAYAAHLRT